MDGKFRLIKTVAEPPEKVDYTKLYIDFCEKYRNVFMVEINKQMYIYRSLGRSEYREILEDRRFDDITKEEIICTQCLLYPNPETYSWDDKEAGIPTELMKAILTDSYLDDTSRRRSLHDFYRAEMYDLDNQITCIINEAFPNIDIEEIEAWDVDKTTKYLSRAEWKLHNMRGLQFKEPEGEFAGEKKSEEIDPGRTLRGGDKANKLSPDKIREREEFLRRHPEFAEGLVDDVQNMDKQETVDLVAPALRPGWG